MSAPTTEQNRVGATRRPPQLRPVAILLLGVLVVPIALTAAFTSYGPLTEESAIRMAFATVAGQVIAILSGFVTVGVAVKRRYNVMQIAILTAIAIAIVVSAFALNASAGDLLLSRLDLIAETNLLNQ